VEIVRGMYEAFADGNVEAVVARLDPKVEWNEAEHFPYADGNPYIGPQAVVQGVFQRLGSEWEYWSLDIDRILDAGDSVVACGRYRAKNRETKAEINAQFTHVWDLEDGKAARFQQYVDTHQVVRAMPGG
jgi:ketosteroid isomerase-like protein